MTVVKLPVRETADDLPAVELVERDRFEMADEVVVDEPVAKGPSIGSKAVIAASIAAIIVALAVISRPGQEVAVDEAPSQTTAAPTTTSMLPGGATGAVSGRPIPTTAVTQPIPLYSENAPPVVPGVISGIDSAGSLIVIDRTEVRPDEIRLGIRPAESGARATLMVEGSGPVGVLQELGIDGTEVLVSYAGSARFLEPGFDMLRIAPDRQGNAVLVSHLPDIQLVSVVPVAWDGREESVVGRWRFEGPGVEVLGAWRDSLLTHQANRVWLTDPDSNSTLVADGRVLAYDGRHLAMFACSAPNECQLSVGPPDDPAQRSVLLPAVLAALDIEAWADSVSISPDGSRLAASALFGALPLPVIVDMETGDATQLADGMNPQAPIAWSPDGQWLAYVYTDDVMVWNFDERRSWRIQVNRELQSLLWR